MQLLSILATLSVAFSFRILNAAVVPGDKMALKLENLPYPYNSLEPTISERTLRIHHDKHHAKYVSTAADLVAGTDLEKQDLVTILRSAYGNNQVLFNNAAQVFNHEFYWQSMKPNGGGLPSAESNIAKLIVRDFGSYEKFRAEFATAANTAFGSGWAWLVQTSNGLKVTKTIGANNPLTEPGQIPLLTCDVWEHAYYLDYQNLRPTYVDAFLDKLVNWDMINARLKNTKDEL